MKISNHEYKKYLEDVKKISEKNNVRECKLCTSLIADSLTYGRKASSRDSDICEICHEELGANALEKILNDEIAKDSKFMDKLQYHEYLYNKFVNNMDCSNKFAYSGEANCEIECEHIKAVASAMIAKFKEKCE